ncbi:MAG: hypothetical protein GY847_35095 [Proteobacteria bacterium]|nr:hypothetical protein [Pseudomonadota bacterium]
MTKNIETYLNQLRKELAGSDRATIQDALSDAEEHLRMALESALETQSGVSEVEVLPAIVEEYGSPKEVAVAYRDIEDRLPPALAQSEHMDRRPFLTRFFGVFAEPRAWGALLYVLFSLVTGTIYFTWAVGGLSFSLGVMILIIGVPVTVIFLLSVQGIALVEGRLVEALLGVRMPRRPIFFQKNLDWWERLKALILGKQTWLTIFYMILQLPLGVIYFTVFVTLIAVALSGIATPVLGPVFNIPIYIDFGRTHYYVPDSLTPLLAIAGALLMTVTMHLAKLAGRLHGSLAKAMLVND